MNVERIRGREPAGFARSPNVDKIKAFAWFIHAECGRERFSPSDIKKCFDQANIAPPANIPQQLSSLRLMKRPKQVLKDDKGYRLERDVQLSLGQKFGRRAATVAVDKLLADLPSRVTSPVERVFLQEALACFRAEAYRATIVMTWNLAYDHLRSYVFANHIAAFNSRLPVALPGNRRLSAHGIRTADDFDELKESEFINVCKSCGAISGNIAKILEEKLKRRNIAAHPSGVVISQLQAEDFISDLVNNVVLKI